MKAKKKTNKQQKTFFLHGWSFPHPLVCIHSDLHRIPSTLKTSDTHTDQMT